LDAKTQPLSNYDNFDLMRATETGILRGNTIELEHAIPEMDGQRVRVVLESFDEPRLSTQQQHDLWQAWIERGPKGPIDTAQHK
jgi:hypothetical protein